MGNDEPAVLGSLLRKVYVVGDTKVEVLKDIDLNVGRGEFATISGASGSGKTTILNIIRHRQTNEWKSGDFWTELE